MGVWKHARVPEKRPIGGGQEGEEMNYGGSVFYVGR